MNIFYLDKSAVISAQYMCDKHVVKMILESAQLLCTAHHVCPTDAVRPEKFYKQTHVNHPSAVWARASADNYLWLTAHAKALLSEYTHRYGKKHKCQAVIDDCFLNIPETSKFKTIYKTPHPLAMDDEYKLSDPVLAYRNYYNKAKAHLHSWKDRVAPVWIS